MDSEVKKCADALLAGKIILYPTDTIWGIGCDATNEEAIDKIYRVKQRHEAKSMLILLDKADKLPLYVRNIPLIAWDLIMHTDRPTTFIYSTAQNLPNRLIPSDGTIAIRIVKNSFCRELIKAIDRPLISTSANISGEPAPSIYSEISEDVKMQMDHIVPEKYVESTDYKPSRMIRFIDNYNFVVVRE